MNALITITGILLVTAAQSRLPTMWWLGGVRIELLPAFVVYGAFTMRRGAAIWLAITAGLAHDALSAAPFGLTAVAYGIAAILMTGMQEALDRDQPWLQMSCAALTTTLAAVAASFVVGITVGTVFKLALIAAISAAIAPLVFFALDFFGMWTETA
jgi:rod shape-determining protein MreD